MYQIFPSHWCVVGDNTYVIVPEGCIREYYRFKGSHNFGKYEPIDLDEFKFSDYEEIAECDYVELFHLEVVDYYYWKPPVSKTHTYIKTKNGEYYYFDYHQWANIGSVFDKNSVSMSLHKIDKEEFDRIREEHIITQDYRK
jgi:hypothetical protein